MLKNSLKCDPTTGKVFWINVSKFHNSLNSKEAGGARHGGGHKKYWVIKFNKMALKRAKVVWALTFNEWPVMLDHINGNSLDDRLSNLRIATPEQNSWNRKIGLRGKTLPMGVRMMGNRYQARICYKKKLIHLGSFDDVTDAHETYLKKRRELYGQFA